MKKIGTLKLGIFEVPLWFTVIHRDTFALKFRLPIDRDILPVVKNSEPKELIVSGSAYRQTTIWLLFTSIKEVEEALDRLQKAGIFAEAGTRKKIIDYLASFREDALLLFNLPAEYKEKIIARILLEET